MTAVCAATTALLGTGAGTAEASPRRAQMTYACQAAPDGFENQASAYDMVVSMELDLPDEVRPGDAIPLGGTFSVQVPEQLRALTADYFTTMQVVSDDLTVDVSSGGQSTPVRVSRVDSGPMSPKTQPMIVSAPIGADPFVVPQDASGEIIVGLPGDGGATSIVDGSSVAFNATAFVSGGIVESFFDEYGYKLACSAPGGADRTLARIPVSAGSAEGGEAPAPAAAAPGGGGTGSGTAAARAGSAPGSSDSAAAAPGAAAAASPPSTSASPALAAAVSGGAADGADGSARTADVAPVAASTSTRSGDVWVPGWLVVVVALVLSCGAIALAVRAQLRVMKLRDELEG